MKLHPTIESVYVGTDKGVMVQTPDKGLEPDYDPRSRPWYKDAMEEKGNAIITQPYLSVSTDTIMITIAKITKDGAGVVGINVPLTNIDETASIVSVGKDGYMLVLDKDGQFISHPSEQAGTETNEPFYENLYKSENGKFRYKLDDEQREMIFTTEETTGWKIAGTMFSSEIDDAARPILMSILIVFAIAIILGGISAVFIIRSITRPLNTLTVSAAKIKDGDLTKKVEM